MNNPGGNSEYGHKNGGLRYFAEKKDFDPFLKESLKPQHNKAIMCG